MTEPGPTLEEIRTKIESDLSDLGGEIDEVFEELVLPAIAGRRTSRSAQSWYPRTLFGFVMSCFAYVDFLSRLWKGRQGSQTDRMVSFMTRFFETDPLANAVAVQIWRHGLMHTGNPQRVRDKETDREFVWLLHWGEQHLPPWQNITLTKKGPDSFILNTGLVSFASHLRHAAWAFFNHAEETPVLAEKVVERWADARVERGHVEKYKHRGGADQNISSSP